MAKNQEHGQVSKVNSKGVTETKVVSMVVRNGALVPDDTSPELGVKV